MLLVALSLFAWKKGTLCSASRGAVRCISDFSVARFADPDRTRTQEAKLDAAAIPAMFVLQDGPDRDPGSDKPMLTTCKALMISWNPTVRGQR